MKFLALAVTEILRGYQNLKVGHVTQATPPLSPNFAFFGRTLVVILHTKFEVSSCSRYRDIEGYPKYKSRSRDLGHAPFVP